MNVSNNKYSIVYADPPWQYKDKAKAGNRGVCCKYKVQDTNWIANLPIKDITLENSILFLWVTMPKLNECWKVINDWGFVYKTCAFTWIKTNKKNTESFFMGMGGGTRANAELCLLATKGKPKRINASIKQIVTSPIREHSRKPDCVRDKIVELCGDLPRIELFSRTKTPGWDVWGNEINKFTENEIFNF